MATFDNRGMKSIRIRPVKVRDKLMWCVDLRCLGRGRRHFSEEKEAHRFREAIEKEIWQWGVSRTLTPVQKFEVFQAMDELPEGLSMLEAVRRAKETFPTSKASFPIPDAITLYISEKHSENCSLEYLRTLRIHLNKFQSAFNCHFAELTPQAISKWKRELEGAPKTRKNICCNVQCFLRWATREDLLPVGFKGIELLKVRVPGKSNVAILTPDELIRILRVCPASRIPPMVISAFCGLRTSEVQRLNWHDIKKDFIIINAEIAKVSLRRFVEIPENLKEWVELFREEGPVVKTRSGNYFSHISKRAGIPWKKNCLRHSWFSYKLARTKNLEAAAFEGGNSPNIIMRNYRELVTPQAAERWFGIFPECLNAVQLRVI